MMGIVPKFDSPEGFERQFIYRDDDFTVALEYFSDQLFIHVLIFNANQSVIKRIKEVWAETLIDAYFQGYEEVFTYTKDNRIVKLIGGAEKVGQHEDYEVYKWALN